MRVGRCPSVSPLLLGHMQAATGLPPGSAPRAGLSIRQDQLPSPAEAGTAIAAAAEAVPAVLDGVVLLKGEETPRRPRGTRRRRRDGSPIKGRRLLTAQVPSSTSILSCRTRASLM